VDFLIRGHVPCRTGLPFPGKLGQNSFFASVTVFPALRAIFLAAG
jgi:hypothetical protein